MSRPIRRIGVWLILAACLSYPPVWGQDSTIEMGSRHRPFAKAGTPRQTERVRLFDVKHIKAELAIDTQNHRLSGVVTHTLSPLHPHLTQLELDCGPDLKVAKGHPPGLTPSRARSRPREASFRSSSIRHMN